ncbi:ATP-dependent helicase [Desulfitobacterium metallireducens]|uniref:DNA 3'-5' helicase n=1 Tax=Desulfitobacterium metallireducens DSM 15288 TaxID=871968 RepID=W0E679_9FIRM|nr:UvrD-helicase domain-containing protein [Desulfitobacterium metallireducens]AHF06242.1 DNA helicase UvrD [Desulfitobacterium metallireducens DSM 15288]
MQQDWLQILEQETEVKLNDVQKQAVLQTEGPVLLLATPGAGKTTVLNFRIAYLILEKGVSPSHILALTFSRAAAQDMGERFHTLFGRRIPEWVRFSTIHSLCYRIVRTWFQRVNQSYRLIEQEQGAFSKSAVLRQLYESINHTMLTEDKLEELSQAIGYIKNSLMSRSEMGELEVKVKNLEEIYLAYEEYKCKAHAPIILLDFDDMLTVAYDILRKQPDLIKAYQQHYRYILMDESQDTSLVQNKIVELLAQPQNNLFLVGDDDQSIFSFRAADPQYLLNFHAIYPQAQILTMDQNYRATQKLVASANELIQANQKRYPKNMFSKQASGEPPRIRQFGTNEEELEYLVKSLKMRPLSQNVNSVAVLYRNNLSAVLLMDRLERAGIPFYMKDFRDRFFKHWVVEDVLNFLRFSYSDKNVTLLEKIFTKFDSYISRKQIEWLKSCPSKESVFDRLAEIPETKEFRKKRLLQFKRDFKRLNHMYPIPALHFIREDFKYEEKVKDFADRLGYSMEVVREMLDILETLAEDQQDLTAFANRLKSLEEAAINSAQNRGKPVVTLSTLHAAKGLEFDEIYLMDLAEGILPAADAIKAVEQKQGAAMEEERRLFYVGITRAKRKLELLSVQFQNHQEVLPSRFVVELSQILRVKEQPGEVRPVKEIADSSLTRLIIKKGALVRHKKFGIGEITKVEGDIIFVQFKEGLKQLSVELCLSEQIIKSIIE